MGAQASSTNRKSAPIQQFFDFLNVIENVEALDDQMQSQLLLIMDALAHRGNGSASGMPLRVHLFV